MDSTHRLATLFGTSHKMISKILKETGVKMNNRGNQVSTIINYEDKKYNDHKTFLTCPVTNKQFYDTINKSGSLSKHLKELYPDIIIPSFYYSKKFYQEYGYNWFDEYFILGDTVEKETIKCKLCDWRTIDITNKSGVYQNHLNKCHKIDVNDYINKFPNEIKYFKSYKNDIDKDTFLSEVRNFVKCPICHKKFKVISNTHVKSHNMTFPEFRLKYPNSKILSERSLKLYSDNYDNCRPKIHSFTSRGEKEVKEFIESLGFKCTKKRYGQLIPNGEIDISIDEKKICIEYNGNFWHTDKFGGKSEKYHLNKLIAAKENGFNLIHIFEDEWNNNKDKVKNKLKSILGIDDRIKIRTSKCTIQEISSEDKNLFLNNFHIQGSDKASIKLGAYYGDELIAVMTFSNNRNMTKKFTQINEFNLSRFATNSLYKCIGIGGKLLKYFISNYKPSKIISFADRRWTIDETNNLYTKLGFKLISVTQPNYWYYNSKVDRFKRFHKFGFGKNKLISKYGADPNMSEWSIMQSLGYDRIWDCGLFKYELVVDK